MADETKAPEADSAAAEEKGWWGKTKEWMGNNRVITGTAGGAVVGSAVPGVGTVVGAVVGGVSGYWSAREAEKQKHKDTVYGILWGPKK